MTKTFATALPLFIVNATVEPSPVSLPTEWVSVVAMFDFWIFFNVVADVSYINNKSSSAATVANSVWPVMALVFNFAAVMALSETVLRLLYGLD